MDARCRNLDGTLPTVRQTSSVATSEVVSVPMYVLDKCEALCSELSMVFPISQHISLMVGKVVLLSLSRLVNWLFDTLRCENSKCSRTAATLVTRNRNYTYGKTYSVYITYVYRRGHCWSCLCGVSLSKPQHSYVHMYVCACLHHRASTNANQTSLQTWNQQTQLRTYVHVYICTLNKDISIYNSGQYSSQQQGSSQ